MRNILIGTNYREKAIAFFFFYLYRDKKQDLLVRNYCDK